MFPEKLTEYAELEMLNSIRFQLLKVPVALRTPEFDEYYAQVLFRIAHLVESLQLFGGFYGI